VRLRLPMAVLIIVVVIIAGTCLYRSKPATIVLIVRHAERNDAAACDPPEDGPPLSQAGGIRARELARVAREARVAVIYASEFCRTQQTVQPLATQLALPITEVDQFAPDGTPDIDALIAHLWANNKGKVVLIAGHTNTVPVIIEKLGGGTVAPIAESEFDNLFIVIVPRFGRTKVIHLRYGAPS
jgi:broad specificity phosphatase PhoE